MVCSKNQKSNRKTMKREKTMTMPTTTIAAASVENVME